MLLGTNESSPFDPSDSLSGRRLVTLMTSPFFAAKELRAAGQLEFLFGVLKGFQLLQPSTGHFIWSVWVWNVF